MKRFETIVEVICQITGDILALSGRVIEAETFEDAINFAETFEKVIGEADEFDETGFVYCTEEELEAIEAEYLKASKELLEEAITEIKLIFTPRHELFFTDQERINPN